MNYDAKIRREIKAEQKAIVVKNLGKIMGALVLFTLPILLLSFVSAILSVSGMGRVMSAAPYSMYAVDAMQSINDASTLVSLLSFIISAPLTFGLMRFYIKLMRRQEVGPTEVLHPLTSLKTLWRAIRMSLVLSLRTFIWMIGPIIIGVIVLSTMLISSMAIMPGGNLTVDSVATMAGALIVGYVLFFIGLMLIEVKVSMYQAGYVRLHDNEFIGTWDATRQGNEAFRGHYGDLLVFYLSFLPWYLIYVVLSCIATLPMILTTFNSFMNPSSFSMGGFVLSFVLLLLLAVTYGAFLTSYQQMSFFRLFERLAPAPEQPVDYTAFQVAPQSWQPQAPAPQWQPQAPTQPQEPEPQNPQQPDASAPPAPEQGSEERTDTPEE